MAYRVRIIGKKGSKSCNEIIKGTGIRRYLGATADLIINYGLAGQRLQNFYNRFPSARRLPMVNKTIGHSKYRAIKIAEQHGILVPESKLELSRSDKLCEWIEKRFNSQAGIGICMARARQAPPHKYYQKFVSNRRSEVRVHGFKWINTDRWRVQRRCGKEGEIAWNFNRGGHFITIHHPLHYSTYKKSMEITGRILSIFNMSFGAADFIIDTENNVLFVEINSCPGFQELSRDIYVNAFNILKEMPLKEALKYTR